MHRRALVSLVTGWIALVQAPAGAGKKRRRKKNTKKAKPKTCAPGSAGPCTYDQCPLFITARMEPTLGANAGTGWGKAMIRGVIEDCCGDPILFAPSVTYQTNVLRCIEAQGY